MLFKPYHIPMIRSGAKTVTRREWSEDYAGPNVGTIVAATTELFVPDEEADCYIRITDRYRQRLGEMTDEDATKEGDYADLYDFKDGYERVYGDGSFDPWKEVDVVEFEYVGRERPVERAVVCAVCDTEWDTETHDECPECGSTKVWDMDAAFAEAGFTSGGEP